MFQFQEMPNPGSNWVYSCILSLCAVGFIHIHMLYTGRGLARLFSGSKKSTFPTVSKRVLILRTWSLIRTFLAFWVLIGSLFIFQGPYFHYFGFIHAKNVIFAGIGSGLHCWQILIFTYAYALIFIHRRFGSLFWLLGVLIGSLFHKKWVLIGSLSQSLGVLISFGDSANTTVIRNAKTTVTSSAKTTYISCSNTYVP